MKKIIAAGVLCLACCMADNNSTTADSTEATADQVCTDSTFTISANGSPVQTNRVLIVDKPIQFFRLKIEPAAILTQSATNLSGQWDTILTNAPSAGGDFELEFHF